jgi:tetratricopeptide (TPR) repeat protein
VGKLLYLLRRFDDSVDEFRAVLRIDPEDLTAHYGLMLGHLALGDTERAEKARRLYLRFKADENAPVITGEVRRTDPWANNEAQPVHEHRSALPGERR